MKYIVYVFYKYPYFVNKGIIFKDSYAARTKIGAWIKALWDTKFTWSFYNYYLDT